MGEITIFENPNFGKVRTLEVEGEPWFVGKDVAEVLKHQNPQRAIRDHVDDEDKGVTEIVTPGGMQRMTIINESGLYSLVLSSKLPTAKAFKRWITSEVIPSIRKHGAYMTPYKLEDILLNPDTLITLMPTQKAMEMGLFEIKETAIPHSDGHITVSLTPKVSGKGQKYFVNRFLQGVKDFV